MKTSIIKVDAKNIELSKLSKAADVLKKGGVVVFPSDTVYGLAANAFNLDAHRKIYKLKGRSFNKPLIIMASSQKELGCVAELNDTGKTLAKKFWPGPLTLILPATRAGTMVLGGRSNLGARIPDCKIALALLKLCGFPLVTTSANRSGVPSAKSGKEAVKHFKGKVSLIIDGGVSKEGKESTVIDVTRFPFVVIREGCIPKKDLEKHLC
ncbi:MAG: threonylcarbamoyl-AMP synthase [Elusimicrobia bacterium]|nr:threonylcarbamoyl-AMP synthase [Candidatus Liberimonas magnetica]